jgi:hypothetical protein
MITIDPPAAPPVAVTSPLGIAVNTGAVGGGADAWVRFIGTGTMPPIPSHFQVIESIQFEGGYVLSGTIGLGSYWSVLRLAPGQSVQVYFAGDGLEPSQRFANWRPADADGDGRVDSMDIARYLGEWLAGFGGNWDGVGDWAPSSADIGAYLTAWLAGRG